MRRSVLGRITLRRGFRAVATVPRWGERLASINYEFPHADPQEQLDCKKRFMDAGYSFIDVGRDTRSCSPVMQPAGDKRFRFTSCAGSAAARWSPTALTALKQCQ